MQFDNNPLSPHLQIYKWQISSLVSIAHRIVGVLNILAISVICFWSISLLTGESSYQNIRFIINSFIGKFFILFLCWSFSFHILSEIRHLGLDLGYGYELKTSKITGILTILCSFIFAISIYYVGKNII
tara:strand:+ start:1110 stop:1496 length:387 start_codon:yes stop_codon:yes gene_type:complete